MKKKKNELDQLGSLASVVVLIVIAIVEARGADDVIQLRESREGVLRSDGMRSRSGGDGGRRGAPGRRLDGAEIAVTSGEEGGRAQDEGG